MATVATSLLPASRPTFAETMTPDVQAYSIRYPHIGPGSVNVHRMTYIAVSPPKPKINGGFNGG